jgi:nicotinamide mononucleotide transporter
MLAFNEWLQTLNLDFIQLAVLVLGVAEVLLARANKVWLYPTGIAAIVLSMYSLFGAMLYAECLLNLYYLVMSIYGWVYWQSRQMRVNVTFANRHEWYITAAIVFGSWITLYYFLITFTPSDVPLWDALVSATGWAGMWLLARRKVENWILLNVSNIFAIPLLIHKQLPLYATLTGFLFLVACKGYFDWMKIARRNYLTIVTEK